MPVSFGGVARQVQYPSVRQCVRAGAIKVVVSRLHLLLELEPDLVMKFTIQNQDQWWNHDTTPLDQGTPGDIELAAPERPNPPKCECSECDLETLGEMEPHKSHDDGIFLVTDR